jgi:hypothetical protein
MRKFIMEEMTLWEANGVVNQYELTTKEEAECFIKVKCKFMDKTLEELVKILEDDIANYGALSELEEMGEEGKQTMVQLRKSADELLNKLYKCMKLTGKEVKR